MDDLEKIKELQDTMLEQSSFLVEMTRPYCTPVGVDETLKALVHGVGLLAMAVTSVGIAMVVTGTKGNPIE